MSWGFAKFKCNLCALFGGVMIVIFMLSSCQNKTSSSAKIYLASSLMVMEQALLDVWHARNVDVDLVFLSSSAIAKQIEFGAPCDVAIIADDEWRNYLIDKGLVKNSAISVASNSLVLASAVASKHNPSLMVALGNLSANEKLIVGDPDFVPLGRYAKQVLVSLGLYPQWASRFVRAHSARHASLLLKQRAAPMAIVYRSDALSEGFVVITEIDKSLHHPIVYSLLVCKHARESVAFDVKALFLSSQFSQQLKEKGFE